MKTRRRSNTLNKGGYTYRVLNSNIHGPKSNINLRPVLLGETQITESEDHPWPPRKRKFKGDIGGEFYSVRQYVETHNAPKQLIRGRNDIGLTGQPKSTEFYHGHLFPNVPTALMYPPVNPMSDDDMDELGATAVSRCKPTNSASDLGVFLGEIIREGLPRFGPSRNWSRRIEAAKAAGEDYLNYQFGWKPIVSEVENFLDATKSSYAALEQLRKDDGRLIRRRYTFPTERESTETVVNGPTPAVMPGLANNDYFVLNSAQRVRVEEFTRKCWFSGAFRYHLPESLKGESKMAELRAMAELIYGLSFTPEIIWQLAPWSWAVDWFTNTGDVISNITDSQRYGLIMPYGYMMVNTIRKYTYSTRGVTFRNTPGVPSKISFVTETKQRRKANPFGFGISDSDLDLTQISILAALGLTRSR